MNDQLSDKVVETKVVDATTNNPPFFDIPWDFKPGESISVQEDLGEEVPTHPKLKI